MEPPLAAMDRTTLLAALAENFARHALSYGSLPGGEIHHEAQLRWFSSGIPEPWFNGVVGSVAGAALAPATIERLLAEFRQRGLPLLWRCAPDTDATDEAALLRRHGLHPFADEPGLSLDLATLPAAEPYPADLAIEPVAGRAALDAWTAVWMDGVAEPTRQRCRDAYHTLGPRSGDYYLGRLTGRPVATVKLFYAAGVVSVQHVMTLPSSRRRGIGRALVGYALRRAHERGYRFAVLTSTAVGLGIYTRLGFRECCRCTSLLWTPGRRERGG